MRVFPKIVTLECFNRGSTLLTTTLSHVEWVGGPVRHLDSHYKHAGMTDLEKGARAIDKDGRSMWLKVQMKVTVRTRPR